MNGLARISALRAHLTRASWPLLLEMVIASLAIWAHVRSLPSLPRGFYKDETSIAYNAYLLATTGRDEFGVSWPMYIESFGDTKNAGYVYLSALVMRIFGLSLWTVRLPSVLCWIAGSCFFYLLGRRVWPSTGARVFLLLQLAFTPSLFCMARVGFEVIALYPSLALFLLGIYRAFEDEDKPLGWAVVAGVAIGASTYMYSTFRLLAPLHCVLVAVCYARREHRRNLAAFGAAAACTVVPFVHYLSTHSAQLTERYREIGYVHQPIPLTEKLARFADYYRGYFGPDYLLIHGDGNPRHHTGYTGELFIPTAIGLLLGAAVIALNPRLRANRFYRVLLGGLVLAPVAAALTQSGTHSLRAFSLVVFAILLAVCGFYHVAHRAPRILGAAVFAGTALHAGLFVHDYYGPYKITSIAAFEYYGQRQAIEKAVRLQATRVVLDHRRPGRHAELHAPFYTVVLASRFPGKLPPIEAGYPGDMRPGEFLVFQDVKSRFTDMLEGLPPGVLYVAAPYERLPSVWRNPGKR